MEIGPLAKIAAAVLLVGLPLLATDEETIAEVLAEAGDRRALYASAGLSLVLIAAATWAVTAWAGIEPRALGWGRGPSWTGLGWTAGVVVAGLASVGVATKVMRAAGLPESRAVLHLMPRNGREKWAFVALALLAGACEEYVFRGFLLHALEAWTGDTVLAVVVSSLSFGLAHGYQRTAGVVRATLLGLLLAVPVTVTGSLFPAVAAHFGINAILGLGAWRWMASEPARDGDRDDDRRDDDRREDRGAGHREDRDQDRGAGHREDRDDDHRADDAAGRER